MKKLNMKNHMYLDYLVIATFAVVPTMLGLGKLATGISLALALVHLGVTLLTFKEGVLVMSSRVHGTIELMVAPILLSLPWMFGFAGHTPSLIYYSVMGLATLAVWGLTDYTVASVRMSRNTP